MKHFFNARENIVTEALDGLLRVSPPGQLARLDLYPDIKVILRADWDRSKVAIISGGGAGHEPSHAGFVGKGMLTAAVSGEIFASPGVEAVLTAIRAVTGAKGCLLIVKNYTGDRLNFGLAAEKARAEGFDVEMVIVADDIALPGIVQPRGVAGTLFVHKIAGHVAEGGGSLADVAGAARAAAKDIVSLGVSLSSCSIPGQDHEERLGPNEGELGLGIHGEPGVEKIALQSASALVATMTERLAATLPTSGEFALLINNLGAVPPLEMSLIADVVLRSSLAGRVRVVVGPAALMTALNMNGFSLSLIRLDPARTEALSAPVGPGAWPGAVTIGRIDIRPGPKAPSDPMARPASQNASVRAIIDALATEIESLEAELNRLDARAGDGDTGSTLATGARSIRASLDSLPLNDTPALLAALGAHVAKAMGGSSGVLISILLTAASSAAQNGASLDRAFAAGLERMTFYGGAREGDRTMVDALAPALAAWSASGLAAAAKAAAEGAEKTASMTRARAGRASYVSESNLAGVPDPGAVAIARVLAKAAGIAG